jgi:hypothetical protein
MMERSPGLVLPTPPSDNHTFSERCTPPAPMPMFRTVADLAVNTDQHSTDHERPATNHTEDESPHENTNLPLGFEGAIKKVGKRYHEGLKVMFDDRRRFEIGLKNIAYAVRAGYAAIRPDLRTFTDGILHRWLEKGLWPPTCNYPNEDEIWRQCSMDMMQVRIEKDSETKIMLRRVAQIRMYYWYEEQEKKTRESRDPTALDSRNDIRIKAIDTILQQYYINWDIIKDSSRDKLRKNFEAEKDVGKKWCELVHYLSAGILVICDKKMDSQMCVQ